MARGYSSAPGASEEVVEAAQPDLHKTRMVVLSQSKNWVVRETIAKRHDCAMGVLITLAHDRSTDVRAAVAANPTCGTSILEHLSGDKHVEVLTALVGNPVIGPDLLERLAFHKKAEVRTRAAQRLNDSVAHVPVEDTGVPELRERAEASVVTLYPDQGSVASQQFAPVAQGDQERPAPPTRTAPVRGFRVE